MLERVVSTLRPLTVGGKGFVFDRLTPHAGIRLEACYRGLAERVGAVSLHVPRAESCRDYNATLLRRPEWTPVEIPVRRLDDCLDDWSVERIDLMKIDVEGAEPRLLAGGTVHLATGTVRHAMIEINGQRLVEAGSSPAALIDQLGALGFEPARLVRGRVIRTMPVELDLDPTHEWDRLFFHATSLPTAAPDKDRP